MSDTILYPDKIEVIMSGYVSSSFISGESEELTWCHSCKKRHSEKPPSHLQTDNKHLKKHL